MSWDLKRSLEEGFHIQIGSPITAGRLLHLAGDKQIMDGLSDLPTLAKHTEVEITGIRGAPPIYIRTSTLLDRPQIFLGWQQDSGFPLLVGVTKCMRGNLAIAGQSRAGKSVMLGRIQYQACRLGYPVITIGLKAFDPTLYSTLRAAAESKTRFDPNDPNGEPVSVPFRFSTLQPGLKTSGVNFFTQPHQKEYPKWARAANVRVALDQSGGATDPVRAFFAGAVQKLFLKLPLEKSFQELSAQAAKLRIDRETKYATSGGLNAVDQQAVIQQQNLPAGHPATFAPE